MIGLWIALGVVALLLIWAVVTYNRFVSQKNGVQAGWKQIDVELTRRHDLIPNLVETVKGYAAHEKGTLDAVITARGAATRGGVGPAEAAAAEGQLSQALGRLLAITESYPNLKADTQFIALQNQLNETEDRIASGRRYYNALVKTFNTMLQSFPSLVVGRLGGFKEAEYFEATDEAVRSAPAVSFQ